MLKADGHQVAIANKFRGLSVTKARESAQVSALVALGDDARENASYALTRIIVFAAQQFNVGKNLNNVQAGLLADDMLERYWNWRFDEFTLMFREAIAGKYGTTYDRIDAPTVHGWAMKYAADRDTIVEHNAERAHRAMKQSEAGLGELLPAEQMPAFYFKAKIEKQSDAQLKQGIAYYFARRHAESEELRSMARAKIPVAIEVLRERRIEKSRPKGLGEQLRSRSAPEDAEAMAQVRRDYLMSRLREHQADAANTSAEQLPDTAA
ncbi:hypothetical protein Q5H92_26420 [Hymenobacter sp. M29]|uniref:Uncharacterized protein n=1 Tax=Hymenobacter mellowenesis TaxID=3063995 RepID=A0ABT9ALL3_9BACT|nr:hypothetical protein [Hymenobacter sp. M29]MDO7849922.1 hypothetical protein [Hymenobacter sp. M29]